MTLIIDSDLSRGGHLITHRIDETELVGFQWVELDASL